MGDFNTPLSNVEKFGGLALDLDYKLNLSNFINSLAFLDVDLSGGILLGLIGLLEVIVSKFSLIEISFL